MTADSPKLNRPRRAIRAQTSGRHRNDSPRTPTASHPPSHSHTPPSHTPSQTPSHTPSQTLSHAPKPSASHPASHTPSHQSSHTPTPPRSKYTQLASHDFSRTDSSMTSQQRFSDNGQNGERYRFVVHVYVYIVAHTCSVVKFRCMFVSAHCRFVRYGLLCRHNVKSNRSIVDGNANLLSERCF